jgi:hypothetical protein
MKAAFRMLVGGAVLLAACQDVSEPTGLAPAPQAARVAADSRMAVEQARIGAELPAFGGMYLDEAGRPTVYVTDLKQTERVRSRLGEIARENGVSPEEIRFAAAQFSYAQLNDAFTRATHAAMPLAGSVFTDLDEAQNRVVVGVDNPGRINGVRQALARAGLAAGSYDVVVTKPIHNAATLRDRFDPTVGGLQIHFTRYVCTLGFNALHGTERSFITNSHCTGRQGGVEGTVYYQPTSSVDGTVIATEVEDPTYFKGGVCPKGKNCRYSDSSRALYSSARGSDLGGIAITTGVNNGSLTVAGTSNVTGKSNNVLVGAEVNKVGRTTGWTRGTVTRTCVNTGVQGSNIMQLCQNFVESNTTVVAGGDSGSSVWTGTGGGSVTLVGLLWGGSSDNLLFVYSPIGQVEQEIGTLTVN